MAFRKWSKFGLKRHFKRRNFRRFKKPSKQFTAKVKSVVSKLTETKYTDSVYTKSWATTDGRFGASGHGTLFLVSNTALGDSDSGQRVGDKIQPLSVQISGKIEYETNGTYVDANLLPSIDRMIIVQYHPTQALGSMQITQVLSNDDWQSLYSHDYRKNFTILFDKTFRTACSEGGTRTQCVKPCKAYIKGKMSAIQYVAGSSTTQAGGIYMILLGNHTLNNPDGTHLDTYNDTFSGTIRFNYKDF